MANWLLLQGFINACIFTVIAIEKNRSNMETVALSWDLNSWKFFLVLLMFAINLFGWIFFR
jgi:hypothetical protein